MSMDCLENLTGAMALALGDDIQARAQTLMPRDDPAAALALIGRSSGRTIRHLSDDLGLSHAATVRLVDRLVADGLVARAPSSSDRRSVALSLTANGRDSYSRLLDARQSRLTQLLAVLTAAERKTLERIAEKVLVALARDGTPTSPICRFCDTEACRACPIDTMRAGAERHDESVATGR